MSRSGSRLWRRILRRVLGCQYYLRRQRLASIYAIQAEWLAPRPRNNGEKFLQPSTNVLVDKSIDQVFGDGDGDWLILAVDEDISSLDPEDLLTDL
jgi:hypothetical protein